MRIEMLKSAKMAVRMIYEERRSVKVESVKMVDRTLLWVSEQLSIDHN